MNEDAWENLDTSERRDHELTTEYLHDALVRFGERELKDGMNNSKMMAPKNQTEKTPEFLRMGKKNSHNRKQLWEESMKLEPRVLREQVRFGGKTILRSSNVENGVEKHRQE